MNVPRLALHPLGMAPRVANLGEWRAYQLGKLNRRVDLTADAGLLHPVATFGMPLGITVAELAIETFFPADPDTASPLPDGAHLAS